MEPANGVEDTARFGVESDARFGVADALDRLPNDLAKIDPRRRRDLPKDRGQPCGHHGFARNARVRIEMEERVEHRVGDRIGDLVGVPFGDGFRGEEMTFGHEGSRNGWWRNADCARRDR